MDVMDYVKTSNTKNFEMTVNLERKNKMEKLFIMFVVVISMAFEKVRGMEQKPQPESTSTSGFTRRAPRDQRQTPKQRLYRNQGQEPQQIGNRRYNHQNNQFLKKGKSKIGWTKSRTVCPNEQTNNMSEQELLARKIKKRELIATGVAFSCWLGFSYCLFKTVKLLGQKNVMPLN